MGGADARGRRRRIRCGVFPVPSRTDPSSAATGGVGSGDLFLSRSDPVVSPCPAHADPPPVLTGGSRSGGSTVVVASLPPPPLHARPLRRPRPCCLLLPHAVFDGCDKGRRRRRWEALEEGI
ncbi:hypothetical protein DAI22_06g243003 [Oryza sativa Japonica Group]|nr:hypothetical protein DAI22_06g243003 [Oryza sativa Japonica Group]